jgi:hypothetical protein
MVRRPNARKTGRRLYPKAKCFREKHASEEAVVEVTFQYPQVIESEPKIFKGASSASTLIPNNHRLQQLQDVALRCANF